MYAAKASKSLKVSKEEGQIVINVIKSLFPKVFAMVENKASFAYHNGYLILNERTYSRAWFPTIIQAIQGKINPKENWGFIAKEKNEARNIPIQGTQADGVKEAAVELQRWIENSNFKDKIVILGFVHDEIIDKHIKTIDGKSEEWKKWSKTNILEYTDSITKETKSFTNFPELKAYIMKIVFERYLDNVTIEVDYNVQDFWTK